MRASLRVLLSDVIDYAGLFPPARLPLDTALRNYARYRQEPQAWMLARFICPAGRLGELDPYVSELFGAGPPLRVSVLGRGGDSTEKFLENLKPDLSAARVFRERHGGRVRVECFETRLPGEILGAESHRSAPALLSRAGDVFQEAGLADLARVYEVPLAGDYRRAVNAVASNLSMLNAGLPATVPPQSEEGKDYVARVFEVDSGAPQPAPAGIKLRCGGLEAAAFPAVEQVAAVIAECGAARVPLKFTAGLHHPTRRPDVGIGTHMHGFLNVFVAGVLTYALRPEYHDLLAIVEEEDPRQFRFEDDFLSWNEAEATIDEIMYARRQRVVSFGSCSFDEPREDLRALGLL